MRNHSQIQRLHLPTAGIRDWARVWVSALLLLALYYLAYRYPFQINSQVTSPTYRDTPLSLQLGKYVLLLLALALLIAVGVVRLPLQRFTSARVVTSLLYGYLLTYPLIQGALSSDALLAETGVFFAALLPVILFSSRPLEGAPLLSILTWFLYVAVAVDLVQVTLFLVLGRLPGLAYHESFSVRFGSLWDDPNGFALFVPFLLGVVLGARRAIVWKGILVSALMGGLVLTQSLTGLATTLLALVVAVPLLVGRTVQSALRWWGALIASCGILMMPVTLWVIPNDWFQLLWSMKTESIAGHLQSYHEASRVAVGELLGLSPAGLYVEAGYVNVIRNHGLLYALAYAIVGLLAGCRVLRMAVAHRKQPSSALCWGALLFLIANYLAMANLPVERIFPNNLLLVICILFGEVGFNLDRESVGSVGATLERKPPDPLA